MIKNKNSLQFQVEPISINDAYYIRNKSYNAKARKYRTAFLDQLQSTRNQKILQDIKKRFKLNKHCLKLSFTLYIPRAKFFTKEGKISRRSKDIDNLLKLPIDFLCNKKYNGSKYLPGCKNLNIDDQYIQSLEIKKYPSLDKKYYIFISLEILDLPK